MTKNLSSNSPSCVDLHNNMSHFKRRPMLMFNKIPNQSASHFQDYPDLKD